MRWTNTLIPTLREVPKEAEAASHQLLLKAGFIRKLASGIYSYLPLGFRVLQNISEIIREEMNQAGAVELLLPALHPAEIWKQSGRYEALGGDKIAFRNRSGQEFVLGPTHEEVITEIARAYLKSYQVLPKMFYQIQTKFRDELRPRFGIIRTKEFIMKDAYSFDRDEEGLDRSYQLMYDAYQAIFKRLEVKVDIVPADPGMMGGSMSHEFMVRSPYGEDHIATCAQCGYFASQDVAGRALSGTTKGEPRGKLMEIFDTPNLRTIDELSAHFNLKSSQLMKTLLYLADERPVAALVRGDHEVHEGKLKKLLAARELRLANAEEIERITEAPVGFTGPIGLQGVTIIVDGDVASGGDFVTGANQKDKHVRNVNLGRDFKCDQIADIRFIQEADPCVKCGGTLSLATTMEVGHVFKLGTRYTDPFSAFYRGSDGKDRLILMGCYGLGVSRIVAAIVEQHHDSKGIVWPRSVCPYSVHVITVNHDDIQTRECADKLYEALEGLGVSCLFDDRNEPAGVKFKDADLIGNALQVVVSPRNLTKGEVEVRSRLTLETESFSLQDAPLQIKLLLSKS